MPLAASSAGSVINGTLGFLVFGGIGVVMVFLFRSMSKHLRKVNDAAAQQELAAATGAAGPDAAEPAQPAGPTGSP